MTATIPEPHALSQACNFTAGFRQQRPLTLCSNGLPWTVNEVVTRYIVTRSCRTHCTVDAVAVRRAADGERLPLNPLERVAVFALLRSRGVPKGECARRLRLSWTAQGRYRRLVDGPSLADLAAQTRALLRSVNLEMQSRAAT